MKFGFEYNPLTRIYNHRFYNIFLHKKICFYSRKHKYLLFECIFLARNLFLDQLIEIDLSPEMIFCMNYLWSCKRDYIKRTTLVGNYEEGGLKMICLNSKINSIRYKYYCEFIKIALLKKP